uniref:Protein kinase domain-containing protein n=1 Tax=Ciona savignyi TaxID=51511 RepID=H2Y9J9_CIOSA
MGIQDEYTLFRTVGKCNFSNSKIHLAQNKSSNALLAVKETDLDSASNECFTFLQKELWFSRSLSHENILVHEATLIENGKLYVVYDMMDYGSCTDLIEAHFKYGLPELVIAYILREILKALRYIHSLHFIHRGVKASHILVSSDGRVKLSCHRNMITVLNKDYRTTPVHDYPKHDTFLLPWLSPEILQQNMAGYDTQSDIYSLGITACELANGHAPFTDMPSTQMLLEKLNGTMPCLLDKSTVPHNTDAAIENMNPNMQEQYHATGSRSFSPAYRKFVFSCLQRDPSQRPNAADLLNHQYFNQISQQEIDLKTLLQPLVPVTSKNYKTTVAGNDSEDLTKQFDCLNFSTVTWDFD